MKIEKKMQELGDRLMALTRKSTGQNEEVGSEGGVLVEKPLVPEILRPNFAEGSLYADCKIINVSASNARGVKIPIANETTRGVNSILGGIRAYVVSEGVAKSVCKGTFSQLDLPLKKGAVVIPASDEIMQDSEVLQSYVSMGAEQGLKALIDYNIVYGSGSLMNGIAGHPSTGFVDVGVTISLGELKDMVDAYYGGPSGKWYTSKQRWNQIGDLFDDPALPLTWDDKGPMLWGYRVVVTDVVPMGTIMLADLTQYVIVQKEMTSAVNKSLKFLENEQYFRYVIRLNGSGLWVGPVTLDDDSIVHPFVMATGEESSSYGEMTSSSSSSSSSSNSSSSSSSSSSIDSSSSSSSSNSSLSSSSSSLDSSSSSVDSSSSSSSSSMDSSSSSSSSNSSASSSSSSVDSSSSSSSNSSASSSSSSVDSSSSSSLEVCDEKYSASGFATAAYNGIYTYTGVEYDGAHTYSNAGGTWYIWYESDVGYWILSNDVGDPSNQWKSSRDDAGGCPNGAWSSEDGTVSNC